MQKCTQSLTIVLCLIVSIGFSYAQFSHGEIQGGRGKSVESDTLQEETLRSVIVTPDGRIPVPIRKPPVMRSSSDIIKSLLGEKLMDQVLHPFAFSQRKRERHQRKMMKLLKEYEQIKTPREQLLEALRKEGVNVDSLLQLNTK